MGVLGEGFEIRLEHQHVVALRKAIAMAAICNEDHDPPRHLTLPDKAWLSEVERMLWPGWRDAVERRYPGPHEQPSRSTQDGSGTDEA